MCQVIAHQASMIAAYGRALRECLGDAVVTETIECLVARKWYRRRGHTREEFDAVVRGTGSLSPERMLKLVRAILRSARAASPTFQAQSPDRIPDLALTEVCAAVRRLAKQMMN